MRFISFAFLLCFWVATHVSAQVLNQTTVCRAGSCFAVGTVEPKLLFEQMELMFKTNLGQKVSFCQGGQTCESKGLSLTVTVQGEPRTLTIPHAVLTGALLDDTQSKVDLILAYDVDLNQFSPDCQSAATRLEMVNGQITVLSDGFSCSLAGNTTAQIKVDFSIDYIDLHNALLAGSYQITVTGAAWGQTAGHALLKLAKKTPETLDEKSIGIILPNKELLLEQARAEVHAKQQERILEQIGESGPDQATLQQMLLYAGGQDGVYNESDLQPSYYTVPMEVPVYNPAYMLDYAQPVYTEPQVIYYQ